MGCCLPFPGGDVDVTLTLLTLPGGDVVRDNGWLPGGDVVRDNDWLPGGSVVSNMDTASIVVGEE